MKGTSLFIGLYWKCDSTILPAKDASPLNDPMYDATRQPRWKTLPPSCLCQISLCPQALAKGIVLDPTGNVVPPSCQLRMLLHFMVPWRTPLCNPGGRRLPPPAHVRCHFVPRAWLRALVWTLFSDYSFPCVSPLCWTTPLAHSWVILSVNLGVLQEPCLRGGTMSGSLPDQQRECWQVIHCSLLWYL